MPAWIDRDDYPDARELAELQAEITRDAQRSADAAAARLNATNQPAACRTCGQPPMLNAHYCRQHYPHR